MLELGSGTGMVSSRIAETLDPNSDILIVTDLPEVIDKAISPITRYIAYSLININGFRHQHCNFVEIITFLLNGRDDRSVDCHFPTSPLTCYNLLVGVFHTLEARVNAVLSLASALLQSSLSPKATPFHFPDLLRRIRGL
jgi:hypothetical protein